MKWIKNLESIAITKTSGKCPYCGSDNTDYTFVGMSEESDMVKYGVMIVSQHIIYQEY